jgi:hypothetical protein
MYQIDLTSMKGKKIFSLFSEYKGKSLSGERLSFTNYYMEINSEPFFGVCGEIHFSRLWKNRWEDSILKMKSGGVNIISTYVFWIHHEEEEGIFDFNGQRDLRRFIKMCKKHELYVIVRIGPFCHGEVRNGGMPDWLYGKPFEVRSLDDGFLVYASRLYKRLAEEMKGLYYGDGGPVIAVQIDNEYMHSAAPWEITTGTSNEWISGGSLGDAYMLRLREIAKEAGIDVPFYTCTGWGGASTPDGFMPLWGGYAFRPWIFYSHKGEHPATEEYIYRDNHNNNVPATYNFEPFYSPESKPYLCCEMGGGMFCSYNYRFKLDFESVDAMANIKIASGCNMTGYYMYHGGTNPRGRRGVFLNEGQVPKLSYDFQAAIGEFGQVRDSFRRLRALHLFAKSFEKILCPAKTVLPSESQEIDPKDANILRYATRVNGDGTGFLFINNYQDHAVMLHKKDEKITIKLPNEEVIFDRISLAAGENCVLPFNLNVNGIKLRNALAQPLTVMEAGGELFAFFFAPQGMKPSYTFPANTQIAGTNEWSTTSDGFIKVDVDENMPVFTVVQQNQKVNFVTLLREHSLKFSVEEYKGKKVAVICDGVLLSDKDNIRIEHDTNTATVSVFPDNVLPIDKAVRIGYQGIFTEYRLKCNTALPEIKLRQIGATRYTVEIPQWDTSAIKELLLRINYNGDVGSAFIDGEMISDNFCNSEPWEIGLSEFSRRLKEHPLTIYITPLKEDNKVNVESTMAGRREEAGAINGAVQSVSVNAIYQWSL